MKAVILLEYGGQLVFNDVPTPTIARDESPTNNRPANEAEAPLTATQNSFQTATV
jgi:hypothetical protein